MSDEARKARQCYTNTWGPEHEAFEQAMGATDMPDDGPEFDWWLFMRGYAAGKEAGAEEKHEPIRHEMSKPAQMIANRTMERRK